MRQHIKTKKPEKAPSLAYLGKSGRLHILVEHKLTPPWHASTAKGSDIKGEKYKIIYKFDIKAPTITFDDSSDLSLCTLNIPVAGGSAVTDAAVQELKDGVYVIKLSKLEFGIAKGTESETVSASVGFTFPIGGGTDGTVVIDIPTSKNLEASIEIVPNAKEVDIASFVEDHDEQIGTALKKEIHEKWKDVLLKVARVNSDEPPADAIQLRPKSFQLLVMTKDKAKKEKEPTNKPIIPESVLSIFIQTRDANKGIQDAENLRAAWRNLWVNNLKCSPIPSQQTASIIFSKDMIYEAVIAPNLKSQGLTSTRKNTKGSLQMEVSTGKKVHRDTSVEKTNTLFYAEAKQVSEINADPSALTLSLKVWKTHPNEPH